MMLNKERIKNINCNNFSGKHIVLIVEDMPVPLDKRVWQEALALKQFGADISIICPKMMNYKKKHEIIEGIDIYRHPLPLEAKKKLVFFIEYLCSVFWEFVLMLRISLKKKINVIHGASPPDFIFIPVLFFKIFGVKYVFDHHDTSPELFAVNFNKKGLLYKLLIFFERLSFIVANYSIATNRSYAKIAIDRGKMAKDKVKVVRNGPDLNRLKISPINDKYKKGRKYLVGYMGRIGPINNIETLIDVISKITEKRNDVQFAILGSGPELDHVKKTCNRLNLDEYVDFYGMVTDNYLLLDIMNSCDVCVNPSLKNEMTDKATAQKIMEYMALKKPIVQFNLDENRYSAKEASLYAEDNDPNDFANKLISLINNKKLREEMGDYGYQRIIEKLSWEHQKNQLIDLYKEVLGLGR